MNIQRRIRSIASHKIPALIPAVFLFVTGCDGDQVSMLAQSRPQEPSGPLPYKELQVKFSNDSAGISLAGTLTILQVTKRIRPWC